jgi:hypothetical protein
VTAWAIALHAMANVPSSVTVLHAVANSVPRVMAIDSLEMVKVLALPVNLTTAVHAATHLALPVTSTPPAHPAAMTTSSNPAPTRTWAPKAA